jgi:hypothetical protein
LFEGKTILISRIIAAVKERRTIGNVVFFYFKQDDELRNSLVVLLKGLLVQLQRPNPNSIPNILEEFSNTRESEIVPVLYQVINTLILTAPSKVIMILDGLDECTLKERKQILAWLIQVLAQSNNSRPGSFRILLSSQDEVDIRKKLPILATGIRYLLPLDEVDEHRDDIFLYVQRKTYKLRQKFEFSDYPESTLTHIIMRHANGNSNNILDLLEFEY